MSSGCAIIWLAWTARLHFAILILRLRFSAGWLPESDPGDVIFSVSCIKSASSIHDIVSLLPRRRSSWVVVVSVAVHNKKSETSKWGRERARDGWKVKVELNTKPKAAGRRHGGRQMRWEVLRTLNKIVKGGFLHSRGGERERENETRLPSN